MQFKCRFGTVVLAWVSINVVALQRARLVLGWVTVHGFKMVFNQPRKLHDAPAQYLPPWSRSCLSASAKNVRRPKETPIPQLQFMLSPTSDFLNTHCNSKGNKFHNTSGP